RDWVRMLLAQGDQVVVSEVADYEVRRELLRASKTAGIARLDILKTNLTYASITTPVMLKAAELWAQARQMGRPTAHHQSLDADAIIAAQAALLIADGHEVIVATNNVSHLSLFVPAARWQDIT
ncbi:MAG: PIN domain-containing protein, partial [Blastocatellia bacterium]